jgi:hypothetical protein
MKIRLHGTAEEAREVADRLAEIVDVLAVSEPYPDRGASRLVRVYVEARLLDPAAQIKRAGQQIQTSRDAAAKVFGEPAGGAQ